MKTEYTLDNLIKIFTAHAHEYEKSRQEFKERTGKNMEGDEFSLPKALLCLTKEIKNLKDKPIVRCDYG